MSEEINVSIKDINVTDVEKEQFLKAVMTNKPFTAIDSMFDGQFRVKFKSLSIEEAQDVFTQLRRDQLNQEIVTDANYMMALTNYRLGLAITEFNDEPYNEKVNKASYKPKDEHDSYVKQRASEFLQWPVFKLSALAEAFKAFEEKLLYLTKEIQTPNFWKADR